MERNFKNPAAISKHFAGLSATANAKLVIVAKATAKATTNHAKRIFGNEELLAPLQPDTISEKARRGYVYPEAPLIATGELRESVYDVVEKLGNQVVAASGSDDVKMLYHELGVASRNLPPRPVFGIAGAETLPQAKAFVKAGAKSIATGKPDALELEAELRLLAT